MLHLSPMKNALLFTGLLLFSSCVSVKTITRHVDEVFDAESRRFALTIEGDTTALRSFLHRDLLYIHSNGLEESLQGHLNNIGGGKIDYQSFTPLQSTQARMEGKTALVDGFVAVQGLYNGYPFTVNLRYSAVYRKARGNWQLLRWQSTKIEED